MPTSVTDDFGDLYAEVKRQQQAQGLDADAQVRLGLPRQVPGRGSVRRVLHLAAHRGQPSRARRADGAAGYNGIRELIERQYGANTAARVFADVRNPADGQGPRITVADLDRIHEALGSAHGFSDLVGAMGHLREKAHIRFRKAAGDDGALGASCLYVNLSKQWPWSREHRKTDQLRRDGGQQVWRLIAKAHGEAVANQAFRNVFGAKLQGHEQDHRVEVHVGDLKQLDREIKRFHTLGKLETFSALRTAIDAKRRGMADEIPLHFAPVQGFRLPTGMAASSPQQVAAERSAAGHLLRLALEREYGPALAAEIVHRALPDKDLATMPRVTLADLDRISQAAGRLTDAAVEDAADLYDALKSKAPIDDPAAAYGGLIAKHRDLIRAALAKTSPERSPHLNMVRASLLFDAYERARNGDEQALAEFAGMAGADVRELPADETERGHWIVDRLYDKVFADPAAIGLDPRRGTDKTLIDLAAKKRNNRDELPLMRGIALRSVFSQVIKVREGSNRRKATLWITKALLAQRERQDVQHFPGGGAQLDQAVAAAAGRRVGAGRDEKRSPAASKAHALKELTDKAGDQGGLVSEDQRAEIDQLDAEVSSFQSRRAAQRLRTDQQRLEQDNVGKLLADADPNVQRPMMDREEFSGWVMDGVLKPIRNPDLLSGDQLVASLVGLLPPVRAGRRLDPKIERQVLTAALLSDRELIAAVKDALPDASDSAVTKVAGLLRSWALTQLDARGDKPLDPDANRIRFQGAEYRKVRRLGKGGFGVASLYEAVNPDNQGHRARIVVKSFRDRGKGKAAQFAQEQAEIRGHLDASHQSGGGVDPDGREHVLELSGFLFQLDKDQGAVGSFLTVTPVAAGGELADVVDKVDAAVDQGRITPETAQLLKRRLIGQAVRGMAHVQDQRQMIHMDLKAANVFVTANGTAKVADFGLSSSGLTTDRAAGTQGYMAPEIAGRYVGVKNNDLDAGADVWSMGAMMRRELFDTNLLPGTEKVAANRRKGSDDLMKKEAAVGRAPGFQVYQAGRPEMRIGEDARGRPKAEKVRDVEMLGAREKLINAMMDPDPKQRPTMRAVASHEYFNDPKLHDPVLQQLTAAIIDGRDSTSIKTLGQQADALAKRV